MIGYIRELRLIPIAVIACACLLVLKLADFLLDDSWFMDATGPDTDAAVIRSAPNAPQASGSVRSWATAMFNFPDGRGGSAPATSTPRRAASIDSDITGTVPGAAAPAKVATTGETSTKPAAGAPPGGPPKAPETKPAGTIIPLDNQGQPSGAERAILERLQERRQELDARARELDIRESLLKEAEKRMEGHLAELKEVESRIAAETQQKNDAQSARFKGLITMYENMKPRDAAKIFDRLELGVLIQVASKIDPRKMADILAQMSPDIAQHLTVELANKAQEVKQAGSSPNELPKIEGQPTPAPTPAPPPPPVATP